MIYRFDDFELDTAKIELRAGGEVRPLEPQVFALLALLVENRERMVSSGELIEKVWDGRVVSDAAVASRIKLARQAIGDDGKTQRLLRTIHRQGFRFVGDVKVARTAQPVDLERSADSATEPARDGTRPSIAVLPFRLVGDAGPYAAIAEALPDDLITELARLRWLFVTARGSSFRLRASDADAGEIGRLLGVRYCLLGVVEVTHQKLAIVVELVDTRDTGVVWADRFSASIDDVHQVREEIRARVMSALEVRIPLHEASRSRLATSESLDAWSSYHLGLQHLYRFNRTDNAAAMMLFKQAIARDPGFARAYAGLSFMHFQSAFLRHTDDLAREIEQARAHAERGLELDPMDPFVNFTMGRSYWLDGDLDTSIVWLDRAIAICPNYAQGIYARAWVDTLAGRPAEGRQGVDLSMRLSPLDPLYYAMLGTRALGHIALADDAEAVIWAERAARSPGAHVLIAMIAAVVQEIAGNASQAAAWAANVRARNPALTRDDFFRSFPIKSPAMHRRVSDALKRLAF
jgi:TolB-like protein